jgi:hypothetical protein
MLGKHLVLVTLYHGLARQLDLMTLNIIFSVANMSIFSNSLNNVQLARVYLHQSHM